MKVNKIILTVFAATLFAYCSKSKDDVSIDFGKAPKQLNADQDLASKTFGVITDVAYNAENPDSPDKVYLGKVLYHDTKLSSTGHNSCNSCHNLNSYGVDNQSFSTGDNGGKGGRNSPTTFNAAAHFVQFWDGRAKDVEEQAGGPVMNPAEMAMPNENEVIKRLKNTDFYLALFQKAFPSDKDPITFTNMRKAIAAFERNLMTKSRFDKYMDGDANALTSEEVAGMKKFIDVGCASCHNGATVGGQSYQKFGVYEPYEKYTKSTKVDNGRMDVTKNEADKFMFKVPSLRNVEKTYPYFHDGSIKDLNEAVKIMAKVQLNKNLTDAEVNQITSFMKTLTADIPAEAKQIPKEIAAK